MNGSSHVFQSKQKKKKPKTLDGRISIDGPPLPPNNKNISLNPLTIFPSKSSTVTKTFSAIDKPKIKSELESYEKWMNPEKIDPNFGVSGDTQEVYIRRSYRRIASSQLFNPLPSKDVSLNELHAKMPNPRKNYVLVEESRLEELSKFENVLRDEKERLGEQCAWLLTDHSSDPQVPVPATRLAMHNICESEMRKIAKMIESLNSQWKLHYKQHSYNRPPVYLKDSYTKSAPLAQRAMKLIMAQEAAAAWRQRCDRDTMSYEDDLSYLVSRYTDAHERRLDYDRYFVLATRYGHYSENEFYLDNRPGFRYWKRVMKAVRGFQRIWGSYWAVRRLKLFRAARHIQTAFRAFYAFKWNYPVIKMRLKIGKRTYYAFCWHRWWEYLTIVRAIRAKIKYARFKPARECFAVWKEMWFDVTNGRTAVMKRFVKRMMNAGLAMTFLLWTNYVQNRKNIKLKVKRWISGYYTFEVWINYTKWRRYMKRLNNAAKVFQKTYRMHVKQARYWVMRRALDKLVYFAKIVRSYLFVKVKRKRYLERKFMTWLPENRLTRTTLLAERERNRVRRVQHMVSDMEKQAAQALRKHLKNKNGKIQLREEVAELKSKGGKFESSRMATQAARKSIIQKCVECTRMLETHNFDAQDSPMHVCADAFCNTIFTSNEQYHRHLVEAPRHQNKYHFWSGFHFLLKSPEGRSALTSYIVEKLGMGELVNCLDCYTAIEAWKKIPTTSEEYIEKACEIYFNYLDGKKPKVDLKSNPIPLWKQGYFEKAPKDCTSRPLDDKEIDTLLKTLKDKILQMETREYDGFYQEKIAKSRYIFFGREKYEAWTDANAIDPHLYDVVGFLCFLQLFNTFGPDPCPTDFPDDLANQYELFKPQLDARTEPIEGEEAVLIYENLIQEHDNNPHSVGEVEVGWRCDRVIPAIHGDKAFPSHAFYSSLHCQTYRVSQLASERKGKLVLFQEMIDSRKLEFMKWSSKFKEHEEEITSTAWQVVDGLWDKCITLDYTDIETLSVADEVYIRRCQEQHSHEPLMLTIDDAIEWTFDTCFDEFWTFFVPSMLMSMASVEDFRKGMLEYAGMIKIQLKKKLNIDMNAKNETQEWFTQYFNEAATEESTLPGRLTQKHAAIRIQRVVRGMQGRLEARGIFVNTFTKRYDADYGACYYMNENTGEMSWYRPIITLKLFPNSTF